MIRCFGDEVIRFCGGQQCYGEVNEVVRINITYTAVGVVSVTEVNSVVVR